MPEAFRGTLLTDLWMPGPGLLRPIHRVWQDGWGAT